MSKLDSLSLKLVLPKHSFSELLSSKPNRLTLNNAKSRTSKSDYFYSSSCSIIFCSDVVADNS